MLSIAHAVNTVFEFAQNDVEFKTTLFSDFFLRNYQPVYLPVRLAICYKLHGIIMQVAGIRCTAQQVACIPVQVSCISVNSILVHGGSRKRNQ